LIRTSTGLLKNRGGQGWSRRAAPRPRHLTCPTNAERYGALLADLGPVYVAKRREASTQ
jgi:hypothetical protein